MASYLTHMLHHTGVVSIRISVKKYRAREKIKNSGLVEWEARTGKEVDWHQKFRGLVHAFVDVRIRIML